jgi:hypothetical protein
MNRSYQHLIPVDFDDNSKVWVYQSNRLFSIGEALEIEDMLNDFLAKWNSHGTPVKGYANLLFGQFAVFIADETATGVSGCSTDSSVRVVKEIEQRFQVTMFDRELLAFVVKDKVQVLPLSQLKYAAENGFINSATPYFNNLVKTKKELLENWLVPVEKSWLSNRLPAQATKNE